MPISAQKKSGRLLRTVGVYAVTAAIIGGSVFGAAPHSVHAFHTGPAPDPSTLPSFDAPVEAGTGNLANIPGGDSFSDILGGFLGDVGGTVSDLLGGLGLGGLFGGGTVPVNDPVQIGLQQEGVFKEFALDKIAFQVARSMLRQMTSDIIEWVRSGFDGNPQFVTNPTLYFEDYVTDVGNQFIGDIANSAIHPDLKGIVQQSLGGLTLPSSGSSIENSAFSQNIQPTTHLIQGEIDTWEEWSISAQPQNNIVGVLTNAYVELDNRKREAEKNRERLLQWYNGFLPVEQCISQGIDGECVLQQVVTPGNIIAEELSAVLTSPIRQLELADETNEILDALFSNLIQELFSLGGSAVGGLLDDEGGGAGLQGVNVDGFTSAETEQEAAQEAGSGLAGQINRQIRLELAYKSIKEASVEQLDSTGNAVISLRSFHDELNTGSLSGDRLARYQEMRTDDFAYASTTIEAKLLPRIQTLEAQVAETEELLSELAALLDRLANAQTPRAVQRIAEDFLAIRGRGHSEGDLQILQQEQTATKDLVESIQGEVKRRKQAAEDLVAQSDASTDTTTTDTSGAAGL